VFNRSLNVETFFTTPFGMNPTNGAKVFGVPLMVLKLMEGEPLDDVDPRIVVPVDPLDPKSGCICYTEQGFLDHLQAEDRAFPSAQGVRPKGIVVLTGRRAGKTALLQHKALYDMSMVMSASNYDAAVQGPGADFYFTSPNSGLDKLLKTNFDRLSSESWIGQYTSTMTNSSMYFEDRYRTRRSRIMFRGGANAVLNTARGNSYQGWYADDLLFDKDPHLAFDATFSTLTNEGSQYVFAVTPWEDHPSRPLNYFNFTRNKDNYLGLALHTWEMNPAIPPAFYQNSMSSSGSLDEFTVKVV